MVGSITSLTNNGLRDWLIQRVSAIILAAYVIFLISFLLSTSNLSFEQWHGLFQHTGMRVFSFMALLALVLHAWIGMWTVFTDYINGTALRLVLEVATFLALLGFLLWGLIILWGI